MRVLFALLLSMNHGLSLLVAAFQDAELRELHEDSARDHRVGSKTAFPRLVFFFDVHRSWLVGLL